MSSSDQLAAIDAFEARYGYDSTYMRDLLAHSPAGYAKFEAFMPLASHREALPLVDYWIARIATMQAEDCGHCLQLNVRMALEAGVPRELVQAVVAAPATLPTALAELYAHVRAVAANSAPVASELAERVLSRYSEEGRQELALCVAAARVFPAIKRTLGLSRSCSLISIDV